jgi:type VI secretion system secreted protein Hcp
VSADCNSGIAGPYEGQRLDMFLELDGIEGESQDSRYADAIDVIAFDWGGICRSPGSTAPRFAPMVIVKRTDKATPQTLRYAATGEIIEHGQLVTRAVGGSSFEPLVIEFNDIEILGGGDEITFSYGAIKVTQRVQLDDGTSGPPIVFEWDVAANQPL